MRLANAGLVDATYPQTVPKTGQNLEVVIIRRNPGHPTEEGESLEKVVREPEVDKHCPKGPQEEFVATHAIKPLERAGNSDIVVIVERRVECNRHE
jgi:hypothetical protein